MSLDFVNLMRAVTAEKNLEVLKDFLPCLPANTCLCFVGAGPHMENLQNHFRGCPVTFTVRYFKLARLLLC